MKEYVCTICGYIHKGDMPDDFRCPVCGAGKEAFREVTKESVGKNVEKPADIPDTELSAMEMSIVCSNLARGCEKQYMPKEQEKFEELAAFSAERRATEPTAKRGATSKNLSDSIWRKNILTRFPWQIKRVTEGLFAVLSGAKR